MVWGLLLHEYWSKKIFKDSAQRIQQPKEKLNLSNQWRVDQADAGNRCNTNDRIAAFTEAVRQTPFHKK